MKAFLLRWLFIFILWCLLICFYSEGSLPYLSHWSSNCDLVWPTNARIQGGIYTFRCFRLPLGHIWIRLEKPKISCNIRKAIIDWLLLALSYLTLFGLNVYNEWLIFYSRLLNAFPNYFHLFAILLESVTLIYFHFHHLLNVWLKLLLFDEGVWVIFKRSILQRLIICLILLDDFVKLFNFIVDLLVALNQISEVPAHWSFLLHFALR